MNSYQTYVCHVCGQESRSLNQIKLCLAQHVGLSNIEDYNIWTQLKDKAAKCTRVLHSKNNNELRDKEEEAYKELIEFEKLHCMKNTSI